LFFVVYTFKGQDAAEHAYDVPQLFGVPLMDGYTKNKFLLSVVFPGRSASAAMVKCCRPDLVAVCSSSSCFLFSGSMSSIQVLLV
jgi:hypothetical protein